MAGPASVFSSTTNIMLAIYEKKQSHSISTAGFAATSLSTTPNTGLGISKMISRPSNKFFLISRNRPPTRSRAALLSDQVLEGHLSSGGVIPNLSRQGPYQHPSIHVVRLV
ncbi:hypothetical protein Nepgr_022157 [Nepenthes gracilis]|uniref:Uncharacterized protein n=1 Tax=Nepenthes gracilis TaxID=150966 RepID=A0AAD3T237_NEPGR|nr:hypothetical protein Nepgr_022157 [Nepenthes gracilis]